MPRLHRLPRLAALLLATLGLAACGTPRVKPMARVGVLGIDGEIELRDRTGAASGASDAGALGLDDATVFQPRLDVDWDPVHVSVEGFAAGYSGRGEAEARLELGGVEIRRGTRVDTDLSGDLLTGTVVVDPFPIPAVDLGVGLGAGYLGYDLRLDSRETRARIDVDDEVPFGFLAARAAARLGSFAILGTVRGLALEWDDDEIAYVEADLSARYRPFGDEEGVEGFLAVGYRHLSIDYRTRPSGGELDLDLELSGPYVSLELWF